MNWFNVIKYPSKNLFFKKAKEEFALGPEHISEINEHIFKHGYPPYWAWNWAISQLENGQAPKEWISAINELIIRDGYPPYWAQYLIKSGLLDERTKSFVKRYDGFQKIRLKQIINRYKRLG